MESFDIIEDAVRYPLNDYKRFLILGLPNLLLVLMIFVLGIQYMRFDIASLNQSTIQSFIASSEFSVFMSTFSLLLFFSLVVSILVNGIGISIMRKTINQDNQLPLLSLLRNLVDGIQTIVIAIIYMGIPTLVYFLLFCLVLFLTGNNNGILVGLLTILYIVAVVFMLMLYTIALGRFAETSDITESLKFRTIYDLSRKIGFSKIILTLLFLGIIGIALTVIGSIIQMIPVIGLVIYIYVISTYSFIISYRSYALLYMQG